MNTVNLTIPTDYTAGYENARKRAPDVADNYMAHTQIGDPLGEAMVRDLAELGSAESRRLLEAAMNQEGDEALRNAPASLHAFFEDAEKLPDWLNYADFASGVRMFHRNSSMILAAFVAGVLIEEFTTNIAKSFFITGRVRDQGSRRLGQNNRHMMEIFLPGGLYRHGDGWKLSVRIRIVHAQIRQLLLDSDDWDYEAWGLPVSGAHLGFAVSTFSARLLQHMKTLGAKYSDEEYASFMAVWRYAGYLMGIPESILFHDADEALELYDIGHMCEPDAPIESVGHGTCSGKLGAIDRRKDRAGGPPASGSICVPCFQQSNRKTAGRCADVSVALLIWRLSGGSRCSSVMAVSFASCCPGRHESSSYARFTALLEISTFDESGIKYNLPDHVYAEESDQW